MIAHFFEIKLIHKKSKVWFLVLFIFPLAIQAQCPPPSGDPSPFFCSQTSWANAGLTAISGDVLGDLKIYGENLQWYSDSALTQPINAPNSEILVDGQTYYVTQTIAGCTSSALAVTVTNKECGCIKEPDFEEQDGSFTADGYNFYIQGLEDHKTCGAQILGAPALTLGSMDDFSSRASPVSVGFASPPDPDLPNNLSKTNPNNPFSTKGIRLNNDGLARIVSMSKEFVAGEVFLFNFSLIMENPGHRYDEQPFFQVRIYDKNNQLVQSRCIVSSPDDCVFNNVGTGFDSNVYSDWSCLKLSTRSIQGQAARVEFTVADCTRTGHFGYVYIDDLYVGSDEEAPCDNFTFGYLAINSAEPDLNCYLVNDPNQEICSSGLLKSLPYPIQICGDYTAPISTGNPPVLDNLTINIVQNGTIIGVLNSPSIDAGTKTYCFTLNESDINIFPPYGKFELEAEVDYNLDCGTPYSIKIKDPNNIQACPSAGCPAPLVVCDETGGGTGSFDLTMALDDIRGKYSAADVDISFFESQEDAFYEINEIINPTKYTNTTIGGQIVYARLDWHLQNSTAADDCFYLVELELQVRDLPIVDIKDKIMACGDDFNIPVVATPLNLAELGDVTYRWYKDGSPLPSVSNIYYVTKPGTYSVEVRNYTCEITKTFVVEKIDFNVDLGEDKVEVCGESQYKLIPKITTEENMPPIDFSQVSYLWNTGETTESITVNKSGTYSVEVTYKGCVQTDSMNLILSDFPEVNLGPDFDKCIDQVVTLTADVSSSESNTLEYIWYWNNNVIPDKNTSSIDIVKKGTYRVEVGEPGAVFCYGEDEIVVDYYDNEHCIIPQGISPNGDQYNQSFDLVFLNNRSGIMSLEIFNRYGVSIYKKTGGYTDEWYGQTNNGDMVVTGTYFYVIKLKKIDKVFDKQVLTGWIYVNRQVN